LAAQHFDHLNIIAGFDELPGKLAVLKQRCEEVGRDPATLETSTLVTALIDENVSADVIPAEMGQRMVVGSPDSIADQIKTKIFDAGIDAAIINVPFYAPGAVAKLGEALKPLVAG
jgi:alkanesulfonate monooxygenase SsuD/methylene tetrahydromethanopterin reductase-like flavin-dependent oxidoreductase (luciferase family)